MNQRLIRFLLVLGLLVGAIAPATISFAGQAGAKQDPQSVTVYITRTGGKYHRDGCRYLSKSRIPVSLKEAAARYEPCKVCKPPRLK